MADLLRQTPIEYELAKVNRFELLFPTDLGFESWMVQSCTRPHIKINSVEIKFQNTSFWTPGQYTWEPIVVKMIQTIGPSTSQKMMEWLRLVAESLSGRMGYSKGHMKDLTLHTLDPTGAAIEEWILMKCMLTDVDFGEFSYDDDKVLMVTFTMQPQRCLQTY